MLDVYIDHGNGIDPCQGMELIGSVHIVEQGHVWEVFGTPKAQATRALLRPLQQDLPEDLASRLVPDLQGLSGQAIVRLQFTGQGRPQGIAFSALAALGPGATLLQGGLDRIAGHAQGSLIMSVPANGFTRRDDARGADRRLNQSAWLCPCHSLTAIYKLCWKRR